MGKMIKPWRITGVILRIGDACQEKSSAFARAYPQGLPLTQESLQQAFARGFDTGYVTHTDAISEMAADALRVRTDCGLQPLIPLAYHEIYDRARTAAQLRSWRVFIRDVVMALAYQGNGQGDAIEIARTFCKSLVCTSCALATDAEPLTIDGDAYCRDCALTCDSCGDAVHNDDVQFDILGTSYCESCGETAYSDALAEHKAEVRKSLIASIESALDNAGVPQRRRKALATEMVDAVSDELRDSLADSFEF